MKDGKSQAEALKEMYFPLANLYRKKFESPQQARYEALLRLRKVLKIPAKTIALEIGLKWPVERSPTAGKEITSRVAKENLDVARQAIAEGKTQTEAARLAGVTRATLKKYNIGTQKLKPR